MSLIPNSDPPLLKQEKTFGNILLGLVGVAGVVGLYFALPFLISVAWGLTQLAVLGGILFTMYYIATSDLVRTHGAKVFRMMVRRTSRAFMSYDPIGALQDHVLYLRGSLTKFDEKRNSLSGIIEDLKKKIDQSSKEYEASIRMAKKASETGDAQTTRLQGNKARRRKETIERFVRILERLESVLKTLHKLREQAAFLIADTEDEVNELVVRSSAMNAAGAALEDALKILEGDPEMQAMYKDTVRALEESVRERVGLIEMVMTNADGLIGGIDVQNLVINEQILAEIEKFDTTGSLALHPDKQRSEAGPAGRNPDTDMQDALRRAMSARAASTEPPKKTM